MIQRLRSSVRLFNCAIISLVLIIGIVYANTGNVLAAAGPALSVDAAGQHAISPYIYGMNFAQENLALELRLPVRRWGGNSTTRYNWQNNIANHAMDWYYENLINDVSADQFIDQDRRTGTKTIMTMPMIGWTPKAPERTCGFSIAKYGAQQDHDVWEPDCGNGIKPDGSFV